MVLGLCVLNIVIINIRYDVFMEVIINIIVWVMTV